LSDLVKNIFRLTIFILVQVYVLNKIPHLHQFIVPYLYFLFILWLPFSLTRMALLLVGFITGLILDYFTQTPGLHAAACVLIAYARPFIITLLTPSDTTEFNYREPSPRAMGWAPYSVYALALTFLHHGYLTLLEWIQFGSFLNFIIKVGATTGISVVLIFTVELLFPRKVKTLRS
jgi:cell shape-determining protein MreD